ncbi:hypothetical protein [Ensifer adhaerens]|uniref:hypothetical protein n=1 Tax=Ensifer adhaerens TaxID=106592 RepID=UPI001319FCC4|nr:hypothetical protein [Ensifer adhaerens]
MWSEVNFGKWSSKPKTLPQILVSDPDWFFWAVENDVLASRKALAAEAETLNRRARAIKIPSSKAPMDCVRYWISHKGEFSDMELIQASEPAHVGSSSEIRRDHLNLYAPRAIKDYDKLGCRLLLKSFKHYWFDGKAFTKDKVEAFFSDPANFVNP